jgi:hypothetical protein
MRFQVVFDSDVVYVGRLNVFGEEAFGVFGVDEVLLDGDHFEFLVGGVDGGELFFLVHVFTLLAAVAHLLLL